MAESTLIQPDVRFIKEVMCSGGEDLKKCYQCATCSVTCTLAPDDSPFPRRQMVQAQWGLKNQVLSDPAIWLCHNCGDCSTRCPRGARPGDVFGALRNQAIQHFAFPGFVARLAARPAGLIVLLAIPAILFAAIAMLAPEKQDQVLEFATHFPLPVLEGLFFTVAALATLAFGVGVARFIKALRARGADGNIVSGFVPALLDIMTHKRFSDCGKEKNRFWGHLLTLWGFAGLAFMGTVVGIGTMTGLMHTPLPFWDMSRPVESFFKIFANACALVIFAGLAILLVDRLGDRAKRENSTYFDWLFLLGLTGVVFTGILSQFARLAETASAMLPVYFVHLVLIFVLFLFAPYTKFAHLIYRTVAMAAARKK
jgi:quinone-modifying oxidoreductase subunit QmoC